MMGRREPCVLYAHTFVHPQLDEYVDEVLFSEPVVITACEFLEQNASSSCSVVKLVGATSPPSFALEIFIQCEGEARFRRLCLPLLYSQSSSNVLEIEAIVTSHMVVRGSYRSLSMVIYGNTAEDLGQFNIEVDIDSTFTNTLNAIDGNQDDLPLAFRPSALTIKEFMSPLQILSQEVVVLELPLEIRKFLHLTLKILDSSNLEDVADKVISSWLSVSSTCVGPFSSFKDFRTKKHGVDRPEGEDDDIHSEFRELLDVARTLQNQVKNFSIEFPEIEAEVSTSKELINDLHHCFGHGSTFGYSYISQNKNIIFWMSVAQLLCSARESCFYFVSSGGMQHLMEMFTDNMKNSACLQLMFLGVIDQATQHSVGCESFLGWWPRGEECPPARTSDGYNQVLMLLLESQRHDVSSFAVQILNRVRLYEVACRYEHSVLSMLGDLPALNQAAKSVLDMLQTAKEQLQKLLKLLKSSGPIDDPYPLATARRHLILGNDCQLTYKTTRSMIDQSTCRFLSSEIDTCLLSLLKERGFLPLSAALLSSIALRSETGLSMDSFLDVVLNIEAVITMLLFCRPGLEFLLHEPEIFSIIVYALRGVEGPLKEACFSVRYAFILISKGFFCPPQEVGLILEMHMTVLCAVDRLCKLTPSTEEFLWVLWDLCRLSRSECGRQALLVLVNFPEAINVLITALNCGNQLDPASSNTAGISPLNLAVVHSTAEIFEVIVTDLTVDSLKCWIDLANELHMALHSSSPGSNKKDAPALLLESIDAGVVYQRNGVIGLLRYAAVLVSGGDDGCMDVDNMVGDSSSGSDGNVIDNLIGKRITEKDFTGAVLRDSSIAQLATALRILAFLSDNEVVAAALYDEGAVMVVHAVIINCVVMLERSSNIYDFLVDDGAEGSSTSDFLLERNREKCLFDLLISSLVLLINLLQKLKDAKEQHRNKNIMSALLQLHREVSSKLVVCAADLSQTYPEVAPSIAAVCRLLASALACWPVYGWTPDLAQVLLDNLHANSLLALGPKDTCSLFCLLNDLLPNEGISRWKSRMPMMYPLRAISVGTILGPEKEEQINWHLMRGNIEKLLSHLLPKLEKLGEIILHCAISMSVVLQDFLRVFVIRIACLNLDSASVLMQPVISWVSDCLSESSTLSDADVYKVNQLLHFFAVLLEHPNAKPIFLRGGGFQMLTKVLERCIGVVNYEMKQYSVGMTLANNEFLLLNWCNPAFESISLICDCRSYFQHYGVCDSNILDSFTTEECSMVLSYFLRFFLVLPFGTELLNCISSFNEMVVSSEGQSALLSIIEKVQSSTIQDFENTATDRFMGHASEWIDNPPLLSCWTTLLKSVYVMDAPVVQITSAINKLASGVLRFCIDGESVSITRVSAIKFLFGIKNDSDLEGFVKEGLKNVEELINLIEPETKNEAPSKKSFRIMDATKHLLLLFQNSTGNAVDTEFAADCVLLLAPSFSSNIYRLADKSMERIENMSLEIFGDTFSWECPENLRNRLAQTSLSMKKKNSLEGPNRHARGDNANVEAASHGSFSKGAQPISTPTGLTRRDAFRQRKPNTSRPPSMHVDDYVARERNTEDTNSSNAIAVPRVGSSGGRPPSIHVDVFMARQTERQNAPGSAVADTGLIKPAGRDDNLGAEKSSEPLQLRSDLDDDLHGIDIVFDAEESDEPDGKLQFPQPDDNLQQPSTVALDLHSPHSMVEETEGDENAPNDYSSRMSIPLSRKPSSSHRKFSDKSLDAKRFPTQSSDFIDPSQGSGGLRTTSVPMNASFLPYHVDPRLPNTFAPVPPGNYEQKTSSNQPLMPPLASGAPLVSQNRESFGKSVKDSDSHVPPSFLLGKYRSDYASATASTPTSFAASVSSPDMYGRSAFGSGRPPLAPIPPYSPNSLLKSTTSQSGFINSESQQAIPPTVDGARSMLTSFPTPPPLMQQLVFRPGSMPMPTSLHGGGLIAQNPSMPILQPLQPPLISQSPSQHFRPDQQRVSLLESSLQIPIQSPQVLQQALKPDNSSHALQLQHQIDYSKRVSRLPEEGISQQQDPGMSLQDYFRSPEAIQYLLSDRDKLCQLLEQHPKLLEMLQERLGQL